MNLLLLKSHHLKFPAWMQYHRFGRNFSDLIDTNMIGIPQLRRTLVGSRPFSVPGISTSIRISRTYADKPAKKKSAPAADISQIPIRSIGVIADFYVPPRYLSSPVTSWHKLLFRRLGLFAINTYSIVKYRRETGLKLHFNEWKETAIDQFVRVNKVFAGACNSRTSERAKYISTQLHDVAGAEVIKSLTARAATFPASGTRLEWQLTDIVGNPKIVSFNALPDSNNLTALVQFVCKVTTKQKLTITTQGKLNSNERLVTDNLVYTLDPFSGEMVLVGSVFDSDHIRGVQPEINFTDAQTMTKFQVLCSDLFRSNPNLIGKSKDK